MLFTDHLRQRLEQIDAEGLRRTRRIVTPGPPGRCVIGDRSCWDFSTNDYLGLAQSQALISASCAAIEAYGVGAKASQLVSGWTAMHESLRRALCRFEDAADALLFSSGYAACLGTVATLVEPDDVVFCDKLNHACLIDGIRLSGGQLRVYRGERLDVLERELRKSQLSADADRQRRWIITETVFGMDGTRANLKRLVELAETYDAFLVVDEAHATGVYGPGGRGMVAESLHAEPQLRETIARRIVARAGTLSKSLGSQGGFVVGNMELIDYLWNFARSSMFSTALSIPNCAAATAAIEQIEQHPNWSPELCVQAETFRTRLIESGLKVLGDAGSPIVPVVLDSPVRALHWGSLLGDAGFYVPAIRPPTVPTGTSRLRISLNRLHCADTLDELANCLQRCPTQE